MDLTVASSSQVVYTPEVKVILGPVVLASRSNLVPSTDPLAASNVEFGRGLQPPSSNYSSIPQLNQASTGATTIRRTAISEQGQRSLEPSVPVIDTWEGSIVTINPDGTTTVNQNNANTTALDLSKYVKGLVKSVTVGASGSVNIAEISGSAVDSKDTRTAKNRFIYVKNEGRLPVKWLGQADTSGLVLDPRSGVRYRPGVVNLYASQPADTPVVHTINWGGYGSVQATPQPMLIIPYVPTYQPPAVDGGEIIGIPWRAGDAVAAFIATQAQVTIAASQKKSKFSRVDVSA